MATTNSIGNKTGTLTVDNALTVTAGGASITGASTLNGGTVGIGTDNAANAITIGTGTSARTINIGDSAAAHSVTLGSTNGAAQTAIKYGTADFSLASAMGNVIVAQDTGEINYPLQSCFYAYLSASTANNVTGNNVLYTIVSDTVTVDQNSDYNNGTGIFTAPRTGNYLFVGSVCAANMTSSNTNFFVTIDTTGGMYQQGYFNAGAVHASGNFQMMISRIIHMTSGDTAKLQILVAGGGQTIGVVGAAVNNLTFFSGQLIS